MVDFIFNDSGQNRQQAWRVVFCRIFARETSPDGIKNGNNRAACFNTLDSKCVVGVHLKNTWKAEIIVHYKTREIKTLEKMCNSSS